VWDERGLLTNSSTGMLEAETEDSIRVDLLELAVIRADLHLRQAAPADMPAAHRQALNLLNEARAWFGPSQALVREQRIHARALGLLDPEEAADPRPSSAWEHYDAGRSYLREGRLDLAAEEFRRSLKIRPQSFWPNFYEGLCSYRMGRFDDARAAFRACVTLEPAAAQCYYNRALVHEALGRRDDAVSDYSRAIELDPHMARAHLNRGILSYKSGRTSEAILDYQRTLDAALGQALKASTYYNLAIAHLSRGERTPAIAAQRKAVELGSLEAATLLSGPRGENR
jgi:tetratricopeptide (TPR) repeat protein